MISFEASPIVSKLLREEKAKGIKIVDLCNQALLPYLIHRKNASKRRKARKERDK